MRTSFILGLTVVFTFTSGCIHVRPHETKSVELAPAKELTPLSAGPLKIGSLLYRPAKFPLDDFFSRLARGEFSDAFARIDLEYEGSNANNDALRRLIAEGYYPLYLEVENTGDATVELTANQFTLENGKVRAAALANDELPTAFKRFSPEAAAANVANVGIVVVAAVAVITALAIISVDCHGCNFAPIQGHNDDSNNRGYASDGDSRDKMLNPLTKTTSLNYKDYLFKPGPLPPRETARGLLFFKIDNPAGLKKFKLAYSAQSAAT